MSAIKINSQQVQALFGVSHVTVYNWRKGGTRTAPLPTAKLSKADALKIKPPVTFLLNAVLTWAKKHGIDTDRQVLEKLSVGEDSANKPGPKPKIKTT